MTVTGRRGFLAGAAALVASIRSIFAADPNAAAAVRSRAVFPPQARKLSLVYFSPTGNAEKAVRAFAGGVGLPFEELDLTAARVRKTFSRKFGRDELVVVGLPVHSGRLPKNIDGFFAGLTGDATPAIATVSYGNRAYDDALIELRMRLEERGFVVKAAASFVGEHTFSSRIATGRPDGHDLAVIADFGKQTAASIVRGDSGALGFGGVYPFVAKGSDLASPSLPRITTNETCAMCGRCAQDCSMGAIDSKDNKTIDYSICIRCLRCVKYCPSGAKQATGEGFTSRLPQTIERLTAQRKEPELFLPR